MSEEELEQDELDGADEDDGEELAAAPCAMAPAILAGIPPRRIPVGEPIFRLFRHGWRRAKAFSFPVAALPFHIVNRSCLPSRRSKRRPGPILHLPESEL